MNLFDHSRKNADPACPQCKGSGQYMYDHNHGTICNLCCRHDLGWWVLTKGFAGYKDGVTTYCCKAGCGHTTTELPPDQAASTASDSTTTGENSHG